VKGCTLTWNGGQTSNLPFEEWTDIFGSERLTGALLDRLTHRCHIIEANGESNIGVDNLFFNQVLHFSTAARLTFSPPFITLQHLCRIDRSSKLVISDFDICKIAKIHVFSMYLHSDDMVNYPPHGPF
jgi:hypothetical protein